MHRLVTVHTRDNQPTNQPTNDQRRHDTAAVSWRRVAVLFNIRHLYSEVKLYVCFVLENSQYDKQYSLD